MSLTEDFRKTMSERFRANDERLQKFIDKFLVEGLAKISGVDEFQRRADVELGGLNMTVPSELDTFFKKLQIDVNVFHSKFEDQGKKYLIVSNHPTGMFDGFFIQKAFHALGIKGKIIGDDIMSRFEHMRDAYIGLSIRDADKSRVSQLRRLKNEIKNGSNVAMFPAGSVSYYDFLNQRVREYDWNQGFIEIAQSNNLEIIPVYIDAQMSNRFYFFKKVYKDIASLLLFRENINLIDKYKNKTINVYVGRPISSTTLEADTFVSGQFKELCENLKYQKYDLVNTVRV